MRQITLECSGFHIRNSEGWAYLKRERLFLLYATADTQTVPRATQHHHTGHFNFLFHASLTAVVPSLMSANTILNVFSFFFSTERSTSLLFQLWLHSFCFTLLILFNFILLSLILLIPRFSNCNFIKSLRNVQTIN